MSSLGRNTVLRRRPELVLRIGPGDRLVIDTGTREIEGGPYSLAVLDEFSRPRPMADALDALQARVRGAGEWRELTETILRLHGAGVLTGEKPEPSRSRPAGYAAAAVHIRMLNDRVRTERFLAAIRAVVRPGDVVVDLGTGTGVLAVAAAQAGASRVYAIEESPIGDSAREVFAANGLADRITLVPGRSTRVTLPERGDVLVSEMIGNDPLEERILELTADAVQRLLKPRARLIPGEIELFGLPVAVPREEIERHRFEATALDRWRSWYGVDFGPLKDERNRPGSVLVNPRDVRGWRALSRPVPLLELDLGRSRGAVFHRETTATAGAEGELNGVVLYFEAELAPGVVLSTEPTSVDAANHWWSPAWLLDEPLDLRAGERFAISYAHRVRGLRDGITVRRLEEG